MGKSVGDDFQEGKITLPVVLSYRRGNEEERAFWRSAMEEGNQRDGDLERAISLIQDHGAIQDTLERAQHYGAMARDSLAIFPDCEEKEKLHEVVEFCIKRSH